MAYQTDGRHWPHNQCTLNVTGPGWPAAWQAAAQSAMANWNGANPNFQFLASTTATDHFASYDFGRIGWLAITQTQPTAANSALTSAVVLVNLHYEWDPAHPTWPHRDTSGPHDLETIVAHELGHVLHLDHDPTPGSPTLMRPTFGPKQKVPLHADDIQGSKHLYP
jgi:predicted Zn-dependent protease